MDDKAPLNSGDENNMGAVPDYSAILSAHEKRQAHFTQKTAVGEFRNPKRISWLEWLFLGVATISMLGVLGLSIERLVTFKHDFHSISFINSSNASSSNATVPCSEWFCTTDFLFTIILIVNLVFCCLYCYSAVYRERQFELLAFISAIVIILIYIVGNYIYDVKKHEDNHSSIDVIKTVRLVLVCVFGPINIVLAALSWWKMGYFEFNLIGSNQKVLNAYRLHSFVTTLQYFHVEIMVNVIVLAFVFNGALLPLAEQIVLGLLFAFLLVVTFLGSMAMQWENGIGVIIWHILNPVFGLYYVYRLIRVALQWDDYSIKYWEFYSDSSVSFTLKFVGATLIIATTLGVVAVVMLSVAMIFVQRNFNLGLKEKIDPPFKQCIQALSRKQQ